jgi:hypothetical protein
MQLMRRPKGLRWRLTSRSSIKNIEEQGRGKTSLLCASGRVEREAGRCVPSHVSGGTASGLEGEDHGVYKKGRHARYNRNISLHPVSTCRPVNHWSGSNKADRLQRSMQRGYLVLGGSQIASHTKCQQWGIIIFFFFFGEDSADGNWSLVSDLVRVKCSFFEHRQGSVLDCPKGFWTSKTSKMGKTRFLPFWTSESVQKCLKLYVLKIDTGIQNNKIGRTEP